MTILATPPVGWKRPSIPKSVKAVVFNRQKGKCAVRGVKIGIGHEPFHYDHRPALCARKFDTEARGGKGDTIPAANNSDFIEALSVAAHHERTFGRGGEKRIATVGSDIHTKAKIARVRGKKAARFKPLPTGSDIGSETEPDNARVRRKRDWPKGSIRSNPNIPSRPFQKREART